MHNTEKYATVCTYNKTKKYWQEYTSRDHNVVIITILAPMITKERRRKILLNS